MGTSNEGRHPELGQNKYRNTNPYSFSSCNMNQYFQICHQFHFSSLILLVGIRIMWSLTRFSSCLDHNWLQEILPGDESSSQLMLLYEDGNVLQASVHNILPIPCTVEYDNLCWFISFLQVLADILGMKRIDFVTEMTTLLSYESSNLAYGQSSRGALSCCFVFVVDVHWFCQVYRHDCPD